MNLDRRTVLSSLAGLGAAAALPAPASAAYARPYGANAPWNRPAAAFAVSPGSAALRDKLWSGATATVGDYQCSFRDWTYAVYDVANATGPYTIRADHPDWGNLHGKTMPWNPAWRPSHGFWNGDGSIDSSLVVLDPATGREWNLWQVRAPDTASRVLRCGSASLVTAGPDLGAARVGDYRTKENGFEPPRGCGIQCLAMLVRPGEVAQGVIRHALSMPIRNASPAYVAPATKSDGLVAGGVPQGTRFALRVTDAEIDAWAAALPLPAAGRRSARVIARALRDYGWIVTDRARTAHLQFEDVNSAGPAWSALGLGRTVVGAREYPRDLLGGLMRRERLYALKSA
jgi:hypothetical protein